MSQGATPITYPLGWEWQAGQRLGAKRLTSLGDTTILQVFPHTLRWRWSARCLRLPSWNQMAFYLFTPLFRLQAESLQWCFLSSLSSKASFANMWFATAHLFSCTPFSGWVLLASPNTKMSREPIAYKMWLIPLIELLNWVFCGIRPELNFCQTGNISDFEWVLIHLH